MKRSAFDQKNDTAAVSMDERRRPCACCKGSTLVETLTQYGARCNRCYSAYLVEKLPTPQTIGNKVTGGPKDWSRALREREDAGERLSPVQKTMWRSALGHHG